MIDKYKFKGRGLVAFSDGKNLIPYFEKHNEILPNAKRIMAGRLANQDNSIVDTIRIFEGGVMKASSLIYQTSLNSDTEVEFFALFDENSFDGHFDSAFLTCSSLGDFSVVAGFDQTKLDTEQLVVSWKIKIL